MVRGAVGSSQPYPAEGASGMRDLSQAACQSSNVARTKSLRQTMSLPNLRAAIAILEADKTLPPIFRALATSMIPPQSSNLSRQSRTVFSGSVTESVPSSVVDVMIPQNRDGSMWAT